MSESMRWIGLGFVVALAACGGSSTDLGGAAADAGAADGATTAADAGIVAADGAASDGPSEGAAPVRVKRGTIAVAQDFAAYGANTDTALEAFFHPGLLAGRACTSATIDVACTVYTCSLPAVEPSSPAAGTLTFAGGMVGTGLDVFADANGVYDQMLSSGQVFHPGDALAVSATGDDVPAFGPVRVTAPGFVQWEPLPGGRLTTSRDFAFGWTGGQAGARAALEVKGTFAAQYDIFVWCAYDASSGHAIVPAAALAPLAGATGGQLGLFQMATTTFAAGDWTIDLRASAIRRNGVQFE